MGRFQRPAPRIPRKPTGNTCPLNPLPPGFFATVLVLSCSVVPSLPRDLPTMIRWCVAKRALPFSVGAARTHRVFRRGWREGAPTTFSEKLRYKLIHDRRPIIRVFSDKLAVRTYVGSIAPTLRLPHLYGEYSTQADVLANVPPAPWVMKATHGSGMVLVAGIGDEVSKAEISRCAWEWLRTDYSLRYWEWQYYKLPRRVIFEEHLGNGSEVPTDYKFYVIHQQVRLITVDQGRFAEHRRNLFRPNWTPLMSRKGDVPPASTPPTRPERLDEMIDLACRLAQDTDFVRVDLYVARGQIVFGELTHAPAAGGSCFEDTVLDTELGSYWHLPDYARLAKTHCAERGQAAMALR